MFTSIRFMMITRVFAFSVLVLFVSAYVIVPAAASAAVYAYVDVLGEVKSVTANDWMTAIATAPNIHINSGVMALTTAADYAVIGDTVQVAK